ncbi:zinc-binding dehydrogenase [Rubrivirga marina]|uniref:Alcohol dehydrogenase n=1 Tax=Rubrivirga marina TaxID=1196024 RepID=A0A271IY17_9BACT|nr:zinc-binding dehydrogenase [Rubrivirga marina]PAP76113.1 alcohol dehydrogenase [Rubrivirga marina]
MPTVRKLIATELTPDFRRAAEIVEEEIPDPRPGEVLVRNVVAGVNASDVNMTAGRYQPGVPPPFDLGFEAAGVVEAVGDGVEHLSEGDAVAFSILGQGFRDVAVVPAKLAVPVPEPSPEALSVLVSGLTASIALEQVGELKAGETVLVTAAAGGTGQYAVQLAKRAGATVFGTCGSDEKAALLRDLGCDRPINYRSETVKAVLTSEAPDGLDVVYEAVGGDLFDTALRALAVKGRLISIGFVGEYVDGPERVTDVRVYHRLLAKSASVRGFFLPHYARHFREHMGRLLGLVGSGELQVAVDPTAFRGLGAVADAVEYLHSGQSRGKVVVWLGE